MVYLLPKLMKMRNDIHEQPIKELVLPAPHLMARLVRANETYMLAGRGTFKTSRGISLYLADMVYEMPQSTGVAVGMSFEHLGDNTLPPLLQALDEFGFTQGDHFVIGKKPPKEWPKPYLGMINEKYDHVMSWHNGTVMYLVSLVKKASANGISAQWGFFDEAKFMDEKVLVDEIFPIFRGNEETKRRYQYCSGYLSKFFATDKNADPGQIKWLLNKRRFQKNDVIDVVLTLQLELNDLKMAYNSAGINRKQILKPQIVAIESRLAKLRANLVHVVEISAHDVVYAHGEKWLKDKRRNTKQHEYEVTYENRDPDRPGESFYPDFRSEVHVYKMERDIDHEKAFIIASDYQHSIAPIPIAQISKLPGADEFSLNYVDEVYAMPDVEYNDNMSDEELSQIAIGGLQEATQAFCDRYVSHGNKKAYYVFDQTATGKRVNADAYYVVMKKVLKKNGWKCIDIYTGSVPGHYEKYISTRDWLINKDHKHMPIRINERCKKLRISISGSGATTKNGETRKDKSAEQNNMLDQSETTHFSDAWDMINHAVLKLKLIKRGISKVSATTR